MTLRKEKLDKKKKGKFLISLFTIAFIAILLWYVCNSFFGVFGRSAGSVSNSEWVSWNAGTLQFENSVGTLVKSGGSTFFRFEEKDGSIEIIVEEKIYLILCRFGSDKIITSDGKDVFYYKGPYGGAYEES